MRPTRRNILAIHTPVLAGCDLLLQQGAIADIECAELFP